MCIQNTHFCRENGATIVHAYWRPNFHVEAIKHFQGCGLLGVHKEVLKFSNYPELSNNFFTNPIFANILKLNGQRILILNSSHFQMIRNIVVRKQAQLSWRSDCFLQISASWNHYCLSVQTRIFVQTQIEKKSSFSK